MDITSAILPSDTKVTSKRYLNVNEAAAYLGVSRSTIFRMTRLPRPEIPFIPYGRTKRFDRQELDKNMEKRTVKAYF